MLVRVAELAKPAFQLRRGEEGVSMFEVDAVQPPLTESEILSSIRPGNQAVTRSGAEIAAKGLSLVTVLGAECLPPRLREAHREIRPGLGMTPAQSKAALKELE